MTSGVYEHKKHQGFQKGNQMGRRNKGNKNALGYKHTKLAKLKISKATSKEKSHWWIKDRSKLKISRSKAYDSKYKIWMLNVKKRDNWKCKISNQNCTGRLEAHHIMGWKDNEILRYEINNGITLCVAHHPKKRSDEIRLVSYFQSLLTNKKYMNEEDITQNDMDRMSDVENEREEEANTTRNE